MAKYILNRNQQLNGDHEVHEETCNRLPDPIHRINLGEHRNCYEAVKEARKHFLQSNGCYYCSEECHTS